MISKVWFGGFIKGSNGRLREDARYEENYKKENLELQRGKKRGRERRS